MSLPRPGTISRTSDDADLSPQWRKPAIAIALLLLAAVVGFTVHRSKGSGPVAVPAPETSPTDVAEPFSWTTEIAALESARAAVFAKPTLPLRDIDRPGSSADKSDESLRTYLVRHSLHAEGMSFRVISARQLSRSGPQAIVLLEDSRSAYVVKDSHGKVAKRIAARPNHSWRVSLRFDQGAWRFTNIN